MLKIKLRGVLILVNRKLNLTIEHLGSDAKGRFVFIRCKIYNNRLALVSIYGQNETDSAFLTQISKTLLEEIDCPLVVGGDFNAVINPALEKSQSDTTANPSSKLLNKFITELNLIDLWRIQNTKAKDFTCVHSRIQQNFVVLEKNKNKQDVLFVFSISASCSSKYVTKMRTD